ncbi:MAG: CDP-alcohol phosphatidyltransferase family protein [Tannerella sp.]|jgi:hypothetical protein|nr:CDP-alcohol phosphatidyltransferase family protein [Tannerella sp.]
MKKERMASDIEATLKSLDTEEFIDIRFYRPIGYRWALLFRKWGVHPNTVTLAAMLIGAAAGACFYFNSLWVNIAGMILLVWANSYDSADGQLARMTGQTSPLGRMLDGFCGEVWFSCIYAAICLRLMPQWGLWIWVLGAVTGFFHGKQAAMADYYRNVHLFFLKGRSGSELADARTLLENFERKKWADGFMSKLSDYLYYSYTKGQEAWAKQFLRMRDVLTQKYPDGAPEWFRSAFRSKSFPLMKYTNMLSFNTRVVVLFISLFVNIPWIYFAFELTVLNALLAYMVVTHERFCRLFVDRLAKEAA